MKHLALSAVVIASSAIAVNEAFTPIATTSNRATT
eukprot:CAMPEP_0176488994 /NCGR_PEP_ID=MMETSP0200_2-20121128/7032_1 /TAXON_ID=947934 /ORGANISM="Chaetoceros sp., Strain GSL56" /LENGTH=34 /DNA_ID= /DNA_START= /DNA_END= /DNA_ORIENTATION=